MGSWAMLPRFSGPELNTSDRVEIVDHVVPGVVVLVLAVAVLTVSIRRRSVGRVMPATLSLVAGMVVALAGLWMTATHVPLLAQALREEVTWGAAVYHSAPGVMVLLLGLVWSATYWSDAASVPGPEAGSQ